MTNNGEGIKTFVIDTNVLIHYPESIMSFKDNEIVIPLWVLEELDQLKTYPDQRGKSAREAIRFLDSLIKKGNLHDGVKLENGSILRVSLRLPEASPEGVELEKTDNRIILCAYELQQKGHRVFFVSKDINARVKATALGIKAVDYEKQKVDQASLYPGVREVDVSEEMIQAIDAEDSIRWKDKLRANEYLVLRNSKTSQDYILRYDAETELARRMPPEELAVCGLRALNERQRIALDLLLNDSIKLVTLVGKAGTGKTLLAIAAGLRMVYDEKKYTRILVSRPVVPMGKDIGFLPGEKQAKLSNWMQPLYDNLEFILSNYKFPNIKNVEQLMKDKQIEIEALTYIRGRSLPNQYIIIDEAQNLTPHEIKTIVSRAGEDTKVVLTGDPYQIDNIYLDANSNGLSYLVEAFKGQRIYGHITMTRSERSELADLATNLL